uniref:MFS transporter n=1 Tax=Thermosporothrix sp. COM3 TaxID=2490863 RepID=A0A455SHZ2_9CHLR|nr:MFS transporter [Thermosporothrix sp. COM3]
MINRNFTLLITAQTIYSMGNQLFGATMLIWAFSIIAQSTSVGILTALQYLPTIFIGPVAGIFIDRWNRRRAMIITNFGQAAALLFPLLAPVSLKLPAIYLSASIIFTFSNIVSTARSGLLQALVEQKKYPQAVSISQTSLTLSSILGFSLTTPLYTIGGPYLILGIIAVMFLLPTLCLLAIRAPEVVLHPYKHEPAPQVKIGVKEIYQDLQAGLRFILKTRTILIICIVTCVGLLGMGAIQPLNIIFLTKHLHMNSEFAGIVSSVLSIGMLTGLTGGGFIAKWLTPRYIFAGSVALLGICIAIYSLQTNFQIAMVVNFIMGIQQGGLQLGYLSLLIGTTPPAMIGRIQSVIQMCVASMGLISAALAGYLGQFLPANVIFIGCGALVGSAGLLAWLLLGLHRKK